MDVLMLVQVRSFVKSTITLRALIWKILFIYHCDGDSDGVDDGDNDDVVEMMMMMIMMSMW